MEIEYLQIREKVLDEISLENFKTWKFLDEHGNLQNTIQFEDDIERELLKRERYDLLIDLKNPLEIVSL
jgi:hypothetical protein